MVGTLDEDFAVESNRGDIILLGTTSWQINRIESVRPGDSRRCAWCAAQCAILAR